MMSSPYTFPHCPPTVLSLPAEINQAIFIYVDRSTLLACSLTCRTWALSAQYLLFRYARVSSPASAYKFIRTLDESPNLRPLVIEFTLCGKLTDTVKPWLCGNIDLCALIPGQKLLPRLRTLRIEHWDRVHLKAKFWALMRRHKNVTALHLYGCHFHTSAHIEDFVFAFPLLSTLTVDSVRWAGDRERVFVRRPEYESRTLDALRTLRICNPYEYGPLFQWLSSHRCVGVRHLELVRFDVLNIRSADVYVRELGATLESLTFGIYLPACCDPAARRLDLSRNTGLRTLALQVYDVEDHFARWVGSVLDSAVELPLRHVALSLTLNHRKTLWGHAWGAIRDALTAYWRPTLETVVFTHHAVPGFLQNVQPMLEERFPELQQRGVLAVVVDRQDP